MKRNNARELMKNLLEAFGPAIIEKTKPVITENCAIIRDDIKSRAPVKTGKLRDSVIYKYYDKTNSGVVTANAVAKDGKTRYGFVLEYTGHAFFYPGVDAHVDTFRRELREAIDRTCRETNEGT